MSDEPLTHIARPPLPWRDSRLTICGKPIDQYVDGLVLGRVDAIATARRLGKTRFSMTHCMTCANNFDRWIPWEVSPRERLAREMGVVGMTKLEPVIVAELHAIAALIAAHRDEFDELVEAHVSGGVVTMGQLRRQRATKRAGA